MTPPIQNVYLKMQKCLFCLAGQADALFVDEEGSITILDWKRTKTIRFENGFQSLKEPLSHLSDSSGWLYCLQLNVPRGRHSWVHFAHAAHMGHMLLNPTD